jgi:hypothetical protein
MTRSCGKPLREGVIPAGCRMNQGQGQMYRSMRLPIVILFKRLSHSQIMLPSKTRSNVTAYPMRLSRIMAVPSVLITSCVSRLAFLTSHVVMKYDANIGVSALLIVDIPPFLPRKLLVAVIAYLCSLSPFQIHYFAEKMGLPISPGATIRRPRVLQVC